MKHPYMFVTLGMLLSLPLLSQQITATVVGTVTDASAAVVSGALIRITNLGTGVARATTTDETGTYKFAYLSPGTYTITVSHPGFRSDTVERLNLDAAQVLRFDFPIEVTDRNETIEVSSAAPPLQMDSASIGVVVEAAEISQLPLNGRNFIQLAQLIPGAQRGTPGSITVRRGRGPIGQSDSAFGSIGLSVNGVRDTANRYFLDGVELMDGDAFTYAFPPSIDSLAEFRIDTNSYAAELGAAPGAQVNLITKAGTKDLHAAFWEFNRNDALTSTYDAIKHDKLKSPRLNRNQFGANIGGAAPANTFFFFNWEHGLQDLGAVPDYKFVPTARQRRGDLTGLVNAQTREPIVLRDPLTVGIVGNSIPASALSPQALTF